jgi:hypothetical protein
MFALQAGYLAAGIRDCLRKAHMHRTQPCKFPVTCSCGRSYSRFDWKTLNYDGFQSGYNENRHLQIFEDLELRRCVCGSTMSVPVRLLIQQSNAFVD